MNRIMLVVIVAILGLGGLFMVAQNGAETSAPAPNIPTLSMQTIRDDVSNGGQLIDVRTAEEYAAGHIDGAVNVSLQDIQAGTIPTAAKDKPVYVYCRSGSRSNQASAALKSAGYQNIIDLGAITRVQSIGGEIKS